MPASAGQLLLLDSNNTPIISGSGTIDLGLITSTEAFTYYVENTASAGTLVLNPALPAPPSMSNTAGTGLSLASFAWSGSPVNLSPGQSASFSIAVNPLLYGALYSGSGKLSLQSTSVGGTPSLYDFSWYTEPSATGSQTFLSSSTFVYTSDGNPVRIQCWGAGGAGSAQNGGAGGAYAETSSVLSTGVYAIIVGVGGNGGGGDTIFSASNGTILVRAPGGRTDGTTTNQVVGATGSIVHYGGVGAADFTGYDNFCGSGGGSGATSGSNGATGQTGKFATISAGAQGGNAGLPGAGGAGGYYASAANVRSTVFPALDGTFPGGGGGGSYESFTGFLPGIGASGCVIITAT